MSRTPCCWCGNTDLASFSPAYLECSNCQTLVLAEMPEPGISRVRDDEHDFYGRGYWFTHQEQDLGFPNILLRARADLPERCLHWLRALLKYKLPPGKVLELGSAHGGFVAMLRWAGFDASGLELSPWIADFARRTFEIPMLVGPVEDQAIEPASLDAVVLMDVLEHFPDPVGTMRHCLGLLKPNGIFLVQTPRYPEGETYAGLVSQSHRFLEQLKDEEHLFLFGSTSIRQLFGRLDVTHLTFEPAIFAHYDMFLVASRQPLVPKAQDEIDRTMGDTGGRRLLQALLDLEARRQNLEQRYAELGADPATRMEVIQRLQSQLTETMGSFGWRAHHWMRTALLRRRARPPQDPPQPPHGAGSVGSFNTKSGTRRRRGGGPKGELTCLAVDLTPVLPGCENGGAKLLALELVRRLSKALPRCEFLLLTRDDTHDELATLDSPNVRRVCVVHHGTACLSFLSQTRTAGKSAAAAKLQPSLFNMFKRAYRSIRPCDLRGPLAGTNVDMLFCPFTGIPVADPSMPVVAVVYDLQHLRYPQFFTRAERARRDASLAAICCQASTLVTISDSVRKTILERMPISPERVTTVYIGLFRRLETPAPATIAAVLEHFGLKPGRFLLYPANFWPHKNHRTLVSGFGTYLSRHPDSNLQLVCTGGLDASLTFLRRVVGRQRLSGRILFPGYVPDDHLAALLQSCMALIFPSLYEGFGMPILEAMAFGKPVVCSDLDTLREVAGEAAVFFDPKDPAAIAEAIERIESQPELRTDLAERGRQRLAVFGGPDQMIQQYIQVFGEAIASQGARRGTHDLGERRG